MDRHICSSCGLAVYNAAIEAAQLRFQPIVMSSLALIKGVLPLATSIGAEPPSAIRSAPTWSAA